MPEDLRARENESVAAAQRAARAASDARADVDNIRVDVDRLLMITEALWSLLKHQHGYNDEDLLNLVNEIDLRDGRLDGRAEKQGPIQCPQCGRMNQPQRPSCLYCQSHLTRDMFKR